MITHGSSDFNTLGYTLQSQTPGYDPQGGVSWTQVFVGLQTYLEAYAATAQAAGARTSLEIGSGDLTRLTVQWSRDPNQPESAEVEQDRWEFAEEPYQIPLFSHPVIAAEAKRVGTGQEAEYRRALKDAVANGDANPFASALTTYPASPAVYGMLSQGVEYWQAGRPTIRRIRTYSLTWTGSPQAVEAYQRVYVRSSLISTFSIPSDVQSQIPTDPSDPPPDGTVWGWRLSSKSSTLVREKNGTKKEEILGWEFGAWYAASGYGSSLYLLA